MDSNPIARKFALTIYENQKDNAGRSASVTLEQLTTLLTKRVVRPSKYGKAFSAHKLKPGFGRKLDNVEYLSMAVADIDDGAELRFLKSALEPYMWIAHSSHSHTPEHHKYRIVLPMSRDVPADEWPRLWAGMNVFLQGHVDQATKDPSRLFFLPSCPENMQEHAFVEVHEGALIDPAVFFAEAPEDTRPLGTKAASRTKNVFAAALERDYPDSYADIVATHCASIRWFKETGAPNEPLWHKFIGVLKHCVDGKEKIHEWSSKFEGYDPSETESKIALWTHGPATCKSIKELDGAKCEGCKNTCTSPIQVGSKAEAEAPDLSKVREIEADTSFDKDELIKKIWDPRVRKDGKGMSFAVEDQDTGQVVWRRFAESIFYPTDLVKNEEGEWEVVVEYFTQYNKKRQFQMPLGDIVSSEKLAGALAAHTIFTTGKNGKAYAMETLKTEVLSLQRHRREIVTKTHFGWNDKCDGFIIGNKEVMEDGTVRDVRLSERIGSAKMDVDYGTSGTRNNWVRLVDEIYNRPGAEAYQFAFLAAAASPLIAMAGIDGFHGVPIAYTGEGGRGKTTVCELACSMWGKGELFKQSSNKSGTTINGLLAKTGIMRNLPWVMDELTGQKTDEISDMLYALSNGQGKVRMTSTGTFASGSDRWDLIAFITGNMDMTGLLANLDRQIAEAVSVRCFEIKIPADLNETVFKGVNFKQLDTELRQNYGIVGRELARLYMKHRAKIVAAIHKLRQEYNPCSADETRERFYIDLICFALAAGRVMKAKDMIRFDLDAIRKWAFENVKLLRRARTERQLSSEDMAGEFINYLHDYTIVTRGIADLRRNVTPEVPLDNIRNEPMARKATEARRFYVAAKAFSVWGKENNVAPSVVRENLAKAGYIVYATGRGDSLGGFNMRLGQGTTRTTGLSRVFEIDYDKVHGYTAEQQEGNVVPISRPGQECEQATGPALVKNENAA